MYRRRRRPVRVVDDENECWRRRRRPRRRAPAFGTGCSERRRDPEPWVGRVPDAQLQIGQECGQRARSAADMLQQRLGVVAEELVEHLGKGLIRQQRFLVAAAGQNDGAARTGCRQDLADQARLADTGFAVDDDETPAESGALDRVLQRGELTAASDECAARRRHPRGEGDRPGVGLRRDRVAPAPAARSRSGSWRRIAPSRARNGGPGSMPNSSASKVRAS